MAQIQIADGWKQSSPGRYGHDSGGRLINAYAEQADKSGKMQYPIFPIGGLKSFATLTAGGAWRGGIGDQDGDGVGYVISGVNVDKVTSAGVVTNIGIFPGSKPVFMARNRKAVTPQVAVCADGLRYIIENDTITTITDTDLPDCDSVTFVGGYFIFTKSDSGQFFITSIDEGTSIDALDFATAEANPDGILVAHAVRQEVVLFGPKSIEFWAQTSASFPFERIPGTTLQDFGLLCKYAVRSINDVPFFPASDNTVRMLNGYQPVRVSTHDQERAIESVADKTTITATTYSFQGHQFYVLSSPTWTWAYDATTGLWHERVSYTETRWRGEGHIELASKRIFGDFESNVLYELDPNTYTEAGTHLIWKLRTPPIHAHPNRLGFDRAFFDTIPGSGIVSTNAHNSNPMLMMRYSDDGGKSWSKERQASTGKKGQYNKRVKFERLGVSKEDGRIFEVAMSAAVIRGMTGAAVEAELLEP